MKDLGRPKEFTGKDEDFQKWSKNTETFFAGAIKSEMILEWSAEQVTEVTQELIDLDFWPTSTNEEKGLSNLDYVLQQVLPALMSLTSYEANDIVANSRKNQLETCRRRQTRYDPKTVRRKASYDHFSWKVLSVGTPSRDRTIGNPASRAARTRLKGTFDDEIKLAGLETLVPEELEKHMTLNSNRSADIARKSDETTQQRISRTNQNER